MKTSSQKKLRKISVLTKENASDWFQQMKSHLHDEKQWKIIKNVIAEQERAAAEVAAAKLNKIVLSAETRADSATEQATSEETLKSETSSALDKLFKNEDWNAKNWKTISTMTALLKFLN